MEISEDVYEKLKKDADDNNAVQSIVRWIVRWIVFLILVAMFMGFYGCHAIDMQKQRDQAQVNAEVRAIESQGMDQEDYIEWLKARNGE